MLNLTFNSILDYLTQEMADLSRKIIMENDGSEDLNQLAWIWYSYIYSLPMPKVTITVIDG